MNELHINEFYLGAGGSGITSPTFCQPGTAGTIISSGGTTPFTTSNTLPFTDPLTVICNSNGTMDVIYAGAIVTEATDVVINCL